VDDNGTANMLQWSTFVLTKPFLPYGR